MPGGRIGSIYGLRLGCGQGSKQNHKSWNQHIVFSRPLGSFDAALRDESARSGSAGKLAIKPHLYSTNYFARAILLLQRLIYPAFDRRSRSEERRVGKE